MIRKPEDQPAAMLGIHSYGPLQRVTHVGHHSGDKNEKIPPVTRQLISLDPVDWRQGDQESDQANGPIGPPEMRSAMATHGNHRDEALRSEGKRRTDLRVIEIRGRKTGRAEFREAVVITVLNNKFSARHTLLLSGG